MLGCRGGNSGGGRAHTCGSLASGESSHIQLEKSEGAKVWGHGFKVVFFFLGGGGKAQEDIYLLAKQFFLIACLLGAG